MKTKRRLALNKLSASGSTLKPRVDVTLRVGGNVGGRGTPLRVSVAKDRTVKRLLHDLVRLGERTGRRDVVRLTMRLHSVLAHIGHDV